MSNVEIQHAIQQTIEVLAVQLSTMVLDQFATVYDHLSRLDNQYLHLNNIIGVHSTEIEISKHHRRHRTDKNTNKILEDTIKKFYGGMDPVEGRYRMLDSRGRFLKGKVKGKGLVELDHFDGNPLNDKITNKWPLPSEIHRKKTNGEIDCTQKFKVFQYYVSLHPDMQSGLFDMFPKK